MPPYLWYNPAVPSRCHLASLALPAVAMLSACSLTTTDATPTASVTLASYRPATATRTPARPTATFAPIATPGPSPTPLTHVVRANETLLGIALRYGVSLEDLIAANPGINPRFLSIGQPVLIPGPEGQPVAALAPTPTPVPASMSPVRCFRNLSGSLWCLAEVINPLETSIEGVSAMIALLDERGGLLASQLVHTPLRQVPPGKGLPLAAWFAPPAPRAFSATVLLLSAMPAGSSIRVVPLRVEPGARQAAHDHLSWTVTGELSFDASAAGPASRVTVVAVAYDESGSVVGFAVRDWAEALDPGASRPFAITVYSLGPEIQRVEVLAEARLAE